MITAATVDQALEKIAERPQVMLVDYHLHDRMDGLDALVALREAAGYPLPGALLTADGRDELKRMARERGYRVLTKPIKPASLRASRRAARRRQQRCLIGNCRAEPMLGFALHGADIAIAIQTSPPARFAGNAPRANRDAKLRVPLSSRIPSQESSTSTYSASAPWRGQP